jgi:uncharacterized protein (TIGR04141 family)
MSKKTASAKKALNKVVQLTILLLKEGTTEKDALDLDLKGDVKEVTIEVDDKKLGVLALRQTPEHPPHWATFFAEATDLKKRNVRNASVSAIFLTRASGRLFAIAFGHGRHLLDPNTIEERFGLRVTLNSVNPDELRSIDVTTLDANPMHGKRQPSQAAPLGEFGLNLDQDILRGVTGKPIEEGLGTQMTGADSLSVRVRTDLLSLQKLLAKYLAKSKEDKYKERFAWVDHIAEVRDAALRDQLFDNLVDELGAGGSHIWAAIPAAIEWTMFDHFRFGTFGSEIEYDDITLDRIVQALSDEVPTIDLLKRKRVYCISKGSPQPTMEWTFLDCLTAEIPLNGARYLLNGRTWYKVDNDFSAKVQADINEIPGASFALGDWGDETEAAYNERLAKKSHGKLCLMDRVMVTHSGMASPIEFCDLFSLSGDMIHVKRYGQSSVLSHLFAQGTVAAESALSDAAFRKAANDKMPLSHRFKDPDVRIDPSKHEVCFAIGSAESGPLALPFFSQVTLRNAYRRLHHSLGYRVSLVKINVSKLTDIS